MPHNKHLGKQGCNHQFRNHKIFNPCKTTLVNFCPSTLFMNSCIQFHVVICWSMVSCWKLIILLCCFKFVLQLPSFFNCVNYWYLHASSRVYISPAIIVPTRCPNLNCVLNNSAQPGMSRIPSIKIVFFLWSLLTLSLVFIFIDTVSIIIWVLLGWTFSKLL
jgi:hypothetical protein